jgi:glucose-6-phosphate isomerase
VPNQKNNQRPHAGINAHLQTLATLASKAGSTILNERFQRDQNRAAQYSAELGPLFIDYSKHHLDQSILNTLCNTAEQCGLPQKLNALRNDEAINNTENRSANYPLLRRWATDKSSPDPDIDTMFGKMQSLVSDIHEGRLLSCSGEKFTDVVNIGIGGSDFGPRLACDALSNRGQSKLRSHFVANIDPSVITEVLTQVPAATTLFIMATKSFGTLETHCNAQAAQDYLRETLGCDDIDKHFIAVTSKPEAAIAFGIREDLILCVPEWVGGRFSIWSGFGLCLALSEGMESFRELLLGGHDVDQHVEQQPLSSNIPVILGLLDLWYRNSWGFNSLAVLPYEHHLKLLPTYLQQLFMESAGKSVSAKGQPLDHHTGGVIWGTEGTNGQHSFHQLLHQGSDVIPCDFIASLSSYNPIKEHHQALLANCFSQSLVLMQGKPAADIECELISKGMAKDTATELAQHKAIPGNRPSTTILMQALSPRALGALIALYEYRLFTASFIWDINPFDQWGVELGKQISETLMTALSGDSLAEVDTSTAQLIARYQAAQTQQQ